MNEKKGKQSIKFGNPPYILGAAAVAGPKEIDGPMARYFDRVSEDATFGKDSWEEGESEMVRQAVTLAIQKAGIVKQDIRYIFAGMRTTSLRRRQATMEVRRSSSVFPWNMEISVPCQLPGRSREVVPLWCRTESRMYVFMESPQGR